MIFSYTEWLVNTKLTQINVHTKKTGR